MLRVRRRPERPPGRKKYRKDRRFRNGIGLPGCMMDGKEVAPVMIPLAALIMFGLMLLMKYSAFQAVVWGFFAAVAAFIATQMPRTPAGAGRDER